MTTKRLSWAVAITTVPERRETLLPRTLHSLLRAGWERGEVRLCVDGGRDPRDYGMLGVELTLRWPRLPSPRNYLGEDGAERVGGSVSGNWQLALWELWVRHPGAHRYLVLQDDIQFPLGLRDYLDQAPYPEKGYLNLFADHWNQRAIHGRPIPAWVRGLEIPQVDGSPNDQPVGKHKGLQMGRGALALIFDKWAVIELLARRCFVLKTQDPVRGWRNLDGAVVAAMNEAGWSEYVHNPGLVQHLGTGKQGEASKSTLGTEYKQSHPSWVGEHFDLRTWVREGRPCPIIHS